MTKKIAISVPDDVAERLEREPNVSAFISEAVRARMTGESVRRTLEASGFVLTDEGRARVAEELASLRASITPEVRRRSAEIRALIQRRKPE
jgi:hypothetical protein